MTEVRSCFACFGATCGVIVAGDVPGRTAAEAVAHTRDTLLAGHRRFTRFDPTSELSRLNADPRDEVPVSADMARFAEAAVAAARLTAGLVDATLLGELERAGYAADLSRPALPPALALRLAPRRRPGRAHRASRWHEVEIDRVAGVVRRPPGVRLDSGGIVKGLLADLADQALGDHAAYAVDAAGDLRLGGRAGLERRVDVASPFDGSVLHAFRVAAGGVATSGIGRRSWLGPDARPAHHLLDPATGKPAYTGVVQATALAPTALEAEARAKAAVLAGPAEAAGWLVHGGVVVHDDGGHRVVEPPAPSALRRPARTPGRSAAGRARGASRDPQPAAR